MKILFLCGSLEPGRDGVGDYTRRLSGELNRQGHSCYIVAIMDKFVEDTIQEQQDSDGMNVSVLRLPYKNGFASNCSEASYWVNAFSPDWISLQYVPFSFHPKGLPFGFGKTIKQLAKGRKLHIMFHELWVGRDKSSSVKQKVLSYTQQILIRNLCKRIKPNLVHTHLPVYQLNLKIIGIEVKALPLFSNINITASDNHKPNNVFRFCFFSQTEVCMPIINFINDLCIQVEEKKLLPELFFIGGNEIKMKLISEEYHKACPMLSKVVYTGFLSEVETSQMLKSCDLGITPIPHHALGKSGTVAAFLAHGISVAAPILNEDYANFGLGFFNQTQSNAILTESNLDHIIFTKKAAEAAREEIQISKIGQVYIHDLLNY